MREIFVCQCNEYISSIKYYSFPFPILMILQNDLKYMQKQMVEVLREYIYVLGD